MTQNEIRFGINIPQTFPTGDVDVSLISSFVANVESLGYHSGWVLELAFSGMPIVDPIPLLSYAAASSSQLKLGTCVMVPALRSPISFAKNVASLDQLCKGRLIVGIAIGANADPYPAFGISSEGRTRRFEEGLALAKAAWTEDRVTFGGRFWQVDNSPIGIKPFQKPYPPIWFGGGTPPALKRAVRMGDGWIGAGTSSIGSFKQELRTIRQYLEEEERDPATFTLCKRLYIAVDRDKRAASRKLRDWFDRFYDWHPDVGRMALEASIIGTEEECADQLGEFASQGVELLILNPLYDMMEQAERLAKDVLPRL